MTYSAGPPSVRLSVCSVRLFVPSVRPSRRFVRPCRSAGAITSSAPSHPSKRWLSFYYAAGRVINFDERWDGRSDEKVIPIFSNNQLLVRCVKVLSWFYGGIARGLIDDCSMQQTSRSLHEGSKVLVPMVEGLKYCICRRIRLSWFRINTHPLLASSELK